jgi:hypothetical protein
MNLWHRLTFAVNGSLGVGLLVEAAVSPASQMVVLLLIGEANLAFALFALSYAFARRAA